MSISLNKTDKILLYSYIKIIILLHSKYKSIILYNTTYFKYKTTMTQKYRFQFFYDYIKETKKIDWSSIEIYQNNPWVNP